MELTLPTPALRRLTYAALFGASLASALLVAGLGTWQLWALILAPDLALLAAADRAVGYGLRDARGFQRAA